MKFSNFNKTKLLLSHTSPSTRKTRSHAGQMVEEDNHSEATTFPKKYLAKNVAIEVTPGHNKTYTSESVGKYHESFMDSIDVFSHVHDHNDWLPTIGNQKRSKGVFVPLRHFNHQEFPFCLSVFTRFSFNQKVNKSATNQHYKFGISYYKSCIECDVHITLSDFFKRTFVSPGEHEHILTACSHKHTQALCLVNRSLKYDDASKDWITEETILSAVTFQLKKKHGVFILHRATSNINLNKLIPHDLDFENFVPNVQGLGFGFLLMEVLHSLSYTITHCDKIFLGCPSNKIEYYVNLGFEHNKEGWKSLPKWVQNLAEFEGDDDATFLEPCILEKNPLITHVTPTSKLFKYFLIKQNRERHNLDNVRRNQIELFKTVFQPCFDSYLDKILTQKTTSVKIDEISEYLHKTDSSDHWNMFTNFAYLDSFPWFSNILLTEEKYMKKGLRGYRNMFELETSVLKYFAVVPIRKPQGSFEFQIQCHYCKKEFWNLH